MGGDMALSGALETSVPRPAAWPRSGEFFAPLPLAAVGLLVVNDTWLKPALHDELTGKLSDVAVCFFMPLFLSELLGIAFACAPRLRLRLGAAVTALLFAGLEVVPPFTDAVIAFLDRLGPYLLIQGRFQMTADVTDLFCLLLIPLAVFYGERRLLS